MPFLKSRRPLDRVFVLSTGRCGSTTFSRACGHLSNWTSGHETRVRLVGDDRFAYPGRHIESDNRLSWMLGDVARRFDPARTFYVHLTRDPDQVARSFLSRWDNEGGIIHAFSHGIVTRGRKDWPEEQRMDVARFYVDVVTANVSEFVQRQPRSMSMQLEHSASDFPRFLDQISAEGDLDGAVQEWGTTHNAS